MGQQGTDLILSPAAQGLFDHSIECKKHSRVNASTRFEEHYEKYEDDDSLKLLYHENDRSETLVTLRADDFLGIIEELIYLQNKDA